MDNLIVTLKDMGKVSNETLRALVADLRSSGQRVENLSHAALCHAAALADNSRDGDGNWDRFLDVISAMPRGSRLQSMIEWCTTYFKVSITKDTESGAYAVGKLKGRRAAKHPGNDLAGAVRNPWFTIHKEKVEAGRVVQDLEWLKKTVAKAMLQANKAGVSGEDMIPALHELIDEQAGEITIQFDKAT